MSPLAQLQQYAQLIYLTTKNRYYDDIGSADGTIYVSQIIDLTNQVIDELELEADWNWARQTNHVLGTGVTGMTSLTLDTNINNVLNDEMRYVQILQDGTPVSNWAVVAPKNISSLSTRITEDMVSQVGGQLIFSRPLKNTENGGTITGDVTLLMPRLSLTDVSILKMVKPKQLLVLGVAKNSTLPDTVLGVLSPSYVQKYKDVLDGALAKNNASARADTIQYDNFGNIGGVGF